MQKIWLTFPISCTAKGGRIWSLKTPPLSLSIKLSICICKTSTVTLEVLFPAVSVRINWLTGACFCLLSDLTRSRTPSQYKRCQPQPFSCSVLFSHNLFPHWLSCFLSGQPVSKIPHEKPGQSVLEPFQASRSPQPSLSAA